MAKGQRKYVCEECGEARMIHWTERSRAAVVRCMGCGSSHLSPATEEGIKDIVAGNQNRIVGEKSGVVISNATSPRKKVT